MISNLEPETTTSGRRPPEWPQLGRLELPREALEHCREITKNHSSTFYLGSKFFPPEQRYAVWSVYATCRIGDDIADELEPAVAARELEAWRTRVRNAIAGQPDAHPMAQSLAWARSRFAIEPGPYEELYLGLRMDLERVQYDTLEELMLYCRRVAGVVGLMITPISGYCGGNLTLERALKMGMAMQLTNILRDVGEDLERGRVYLPRRMMDRYGVTDDDLRAGRITRGYIALMRELEQLARSLYREGWRGLPQLRGPAAFAVAMAAASYEGILGKLERNGWNNFSIRAHVPNREKLIMIPRVWWALRTAASDA